MISLAPLGHSGSREQARSLTGGLPADLSGERVNIDCGPLVVSSPSFFDELIKQVLVVRTADALVLDNVVARLQRHAERSAANRGVSDRLEVSSGAS